MSNEEENNEKQSLSNKYPRSIFFIIGHEFCERSTYYGWRTVLTIYLIEQLSYDKNGATLIFHFLLMLTYFMVLFGAIIADSWLGKFRTVLYLSILYAIGTIILFVGSVPMDIHSMKITSLIGLTVIGIGTGSIKPCVSAFGGDQFAANQDKERKRFFSFFYLAVHLGSIMSTFLTPILRADVRCFGQNSCFPLAFGVPALLMITSLIIFVSGKSFYKRRPPEENVIANVSKCICYSLGKKVRSTVKKKEHWLDYADDKFDKSLIENIKVVLRVLVLFIPIPIFWALYEQQGSRWTLQATKMNGEINGYHIKPDQIQVLTPILFITFVPLYDYCVYPLLNRCNLLNKPLQRMATGGFIAALSFVVAGIVEINVESALPVLPKMGESELIIVNNSPCLLKITQLETSIDAFQNKTVQNLVLGEVQSWELHPNCATPVQPKVLAFKPSVPVESMMITLQEGQLEVLKVNDSKIKSPTAEPRIRIFYNINPPSENFTFLFLKENSDEIFNVGEIVNSSSSGITLYYTLPPGHYKIYVPYNETDYFESPVGEATFKSGATYIVSIFYKESGDDKVFQNFGVLQTVQGNTVPLFYQIPQYLVLSTGDVMFVITGLEFAYSQSPASMKTLMQAAWLLTVGIGNLVVFIVAKLNFFEKEYYELFFFAALMAIDMLIFTVLAHFYEYVDATKSNTVNLVVASVDGEKVNIKNES